MLILLFGIEKAFTGALILLLTPLYHFGAFVFKIFLILSTGNLLETESYKLMLENFYIVLGIVLLFFLAFTLLKTMVNPDDTTKTATTAKKVVINLVTSGIIIALLPTIFSFLFDFQHAFLVRQNTIGRFFGYGSTTSAENYEPDSSSVRTIEVASYTLANGVWTAFFNVDPEHEDCIEVYDETLSEKEKLATCQDTIESDDKRAFIGGAVLVRNDGTVENASGKHSFTTTMKYVENTGSFGAYKIFAQEVVDDKVSMNFLLAVVAGILLIYVGVSYSIDMAVRLVKLIFYQLIAPIPVFARVIPEGKMSSMFNEWLKITFTCYFEVFIRIFIFYFCIYLCNAMLETDFISGTNPDPKVINIWQYGFWTALFTQAMIIIGLILFMKQAPGLISKLFGIDSSNMKLGVKDKLKEAVSAVPGAAAVGTLAKKTISGIDAKRNGYNFKDGWDRIEGKGPISKLKKTYSSFFPYSASSYESRRKADEKSKELQSKVETGERNREKITEEMYSQNPDYKYETYKDSKGIEHKRYYSLDEKTGEKKYVVAESGDYIKSLKSKNAERYGDLVKAYENRSTSKKNMLDAKAEYEAAQASGDKARISAASKAYNEFKDSYEAYDAEWKQLIGSSKFRKENEIFTSMKYIEDREKGLISPQRENTTGYQATRRDSDSQNPATEQPKIIIPEQFGGKPRKNETVSQESVQQEYNNLINQYNAASPGPERDKLRKQIEDFEKRH